MNIKKLAKLFALIPLPLALVQTASAVEITVLEDRLKAVGIQDAARDFEKQTGIKVNVIETGHGSTLIKDAWTGRYFRCDYEFIRKKCNDLTYRLWSAMEMNLNSLYYEIPNMEPADCGEYVGWIAEDGPIEPFFTSTFSAWGEPCAVMQFQISPHYLR